MAMLKAWSNEVIVTDYAIKSYIVNVEPLLVKTVDPKGIARQRIIDRMQRVRTSGPQIRKKLREILPTFGRIIHGMPIDGVTLWYNDHYRVAFFCTSVGKAYQVQLCAEVPLPEEKVGLRKNGDRKVWNEHVS